MLSDAAHILLKPYNTPPPRGPIGEDLFLSAEALLRGRTITGWLDDVTADDAIRQAQVDAARADQSKAAKRDAEGKTKEKALTRDDSDDEDQMRAVSQVLDVEEYDSDAGESRQPPGPSTESDKKLTAADKDELITMTDEMYRSLRKCLLLACPLMKMGIENAESNDRPGPYAISPNEPIKDFEIEHGFNKFRLEPHQRDAVGRYKHLVDNYKGLIIADEPGLGKTAVVVAHLQLEINAARVEGRTSFYAVFAPGGLIPHWIKEFKRSSLLVGEYTTTNIYRPNNCYQALLTQFINWHAIREDRKAELDALRARAGGPVVEDLGRLSLPLFSIQYTEVIIDEAQAIKDDETILARAMRSLRTTARVAITGIPMHRSCPERSY
ncbi:unnamed protein product [Zymoseptoria tritici ST99CH_1E4]|uniref:SNF2 N-terminal domain-containing protein n=1 Tax=Zymoseptoria tritici ST99CH_1E4 TaxID=1276532 RepID=A0A2H1H9C9_ZYMTR|nr:unnamed protein product [Zymoseptoria tritici ST99CH_1E4]